VSATDHWLAIESSELHCGILADHTLRCLRAGISTGTPDMTWSTVSSGGAHACGTHLDGTLWCWGDLVSGGSTTTPVQIGTETNWVEVAAAATHLCGRRSDRSTWCWGGNYSGELGDDRAWRWLPTPIVQ
jgi:hypothetical protein